MIKKSSNSKVSKNTGKVQQLEPEVPNDQNVEKLVGQLPAAGNTDTAYAIVEIYEAVERSYRAAALAGGLRPQVTHSTNY